MSSSPSAAMGRCSRSSRCSRRPMSPSGSSRWVPATSWPATSASRIGVGPCRRRAHRRDAAADRPRPPDDRRQAQYFAVACGVGFDAEVMKATAKVHKLRWGKLAYLASAFRQSRTHAQRHPRDHDRWGGEHDGGDPGLHRQLRRMGRGARTAPAGRAGRRRAGCDRRPGGGPDPRAARRMGGAPPGRARRELGRARLPGPSAQGEALERAERLVETTAASWARRRSASRSGPPRSP